jgi:hypothetical protein
VSASIRSREIRNGRGGRRIDTEVAMTKSTLFATVSLLAALALGTAQAQNPPPPAAGGPQYPPGNPPPGGVLQEQEGAPGQGQNAVDNTWPAVFAISVELIRSEKSQRDFVLVRGLVTSTAWTQPQLTPINQGTPIDGVLDLLLEAEPPKHPAPLGEFMEVDAMLMLGHDHPYKSIRVRSANNSITLKALPGYAEVKKLKNDCTKCIGKHFVVKGETAPAGVPAADILREEDLLWEVRVIKPHDGIHSYTLNPNRLTLVLTDDGRISDAAWD